MWLFVSVNTDLQRLRDISSIKWLKYRLLERYDGLYFALMDALRLSQNIVSPERSQQVDATMFEYHPSIPMETFESVE